jgi:hypothetical protein
VHERTEQVVAIVTEMPSTHERLKGAKISIASLDDRD